LARPKKALKADIIPLTITYTVAPAFIVTCDDPRLSGISGVARTAKQATMNLRAEIKHRYPVQQYELTEKTTTPALMLATSWKDPVFEDARN